MYYNAEHYPDPTAGGAHGHIEKEEKRLNTGKRFEADWRDSVPRSVWYYRLRDSPGNFYGGAQEGVRFTADNICDCVLFKYPMLCLVELKTIDQKSIPLTKIFGDWKKEKGVYKKEKHIREMAAAAQHDGISAVVVIEFRPIRRTFAVSAADVLAFLAAGERKSIPWQWAAVKGIEVDQRQLKVNWRYDVAGLLARLEKVGESK